MSKNSSLVLEAVDETNKEGISIFHDKRWNSPKGGWLDGTAGTWLQKPEGLILYVGSTQSEPSAGVLRGYVHDSVKEKDGGSFLFSSPSTKSGSWLVISTIEFASLPTHKR
jgi:hypothetical protein